MGKFNPKDEPSPRTDCVRSSKFHCILKEIENDEYLTVMFDTSDHKILKLLPGLFRSLTPEKRVQIKFTEFLT
jgi:hypothetical protein